MGIDKVSEKIGIITEFVDGEDGYLSIERSEGKWYVECWIHKKKQMIYNEYAASNDLDLTLGEVIRRLAKAVYSRQNNKSE